MSLIDGLSKHIDIDIGALFASLRRNWLLIFGGAIALAILAWIVCLLIVPDYRAQARILIESREPGVARLNGETTTKRPLMDPEGMKTQVEVLTSGALLKQVSDRLNLAEEAAFTATNIKPWTRVLILLGMHDDPADQSPDERVLQKLRQNLQVFSDTGSSAIIVQYASSNANKAAEIANAVAEAYIALHDTARLESYDDARGWLAQEIEGLRGKVHASEAKIAAYRAAKVPLAAQANSSIAPEKIVEVRSQLTRLRADRAALEARAEAVRQAIASGVDGDALPVDVTSGTMQRLAERRIELNSQIADLSLTLLEEHPRIKALRSQLVDVEHQIKAEERKLLASLNDEINAAKLHEDELTATLNRLRAQETQAGTQKVERRALELEAATQRQLLETYQTRYREAAAHARSNGASPYARILARADVPAAPYTPKTLPIVSATFVVGLLLLSAFVLFREVLNARARVSADERRFATVEEVAMPVIAVATGMAFAPASEDQPVQRWTSPLMSGTSVIADENPHSVKFVADRLMAGTLKRVIAVSPEGDNASAATVKLVREIADRGKRAILIDMTAHGTLGLVMLDGNNCAGITELLAGECRFNDVIHADHYSQAHIMPLGRVRPENAMRSADRLPYILDALETVYDFVVTECGPSTSRQIRRIADGPAVVIMNVVEPDDNSVIIAALDMDQDGYEDVIIMMDNSRQAVGSDIGMRPPEPDFTPRSHYSFV
ncbi:GumC family protein [Ochrobactrum chromiisoli]|uniref:Exopolysaccharide transport family protein n=2 Tax=Ochrobactrum TaxID=528 RepID=A0ABT3QKR2_9HYPH|nr:exopolysaccharide transport family protein [Ochrobactrum chromiisoli]MCX2696196.1 exopolysaccharide transport family protein [Ochrobactrum chromiisoli]